MYVNEVTLVTKRLTGGDQDSDDKFDTELSAPIANLDIEDWLIDLIQQPNNLSSNKPNDDLELNDEDDDQQLSSSSECNKVNKSLSNRNHHRRRRLSESLTSGGQNQTSSSNEAPDEQPDLCNSLEDLVKTFDKNVKECLKNYKNIDIGQLAPVQVRTEDDLVNDSQYVYF